MKAFEVMGTVDEKGQLLLDKPLEIHTSSQVRVIILVSDDIESDLDDNDQDIDNELLDISASALQDYVTGKDKGISSQELKRQLLGENFA